MKYSDFIVIIDFLGSHMTEDQATDLLDKAKDHLNQQEILSLGNYQAFEFCGNTCPLYGLTSEYAGECGHY